MNYLSFASYIGDLPTTQEANTTDKAVSGDPAERNLKTLDRSDKLSDSLSDFFGGVFCEENPSQ